MCICFELVRLVSLMVYFCVFCIYQLAGARPVDPVVGRRLENLILDDKPYTNGTHVPVSGTPKPATTQNEMPVSPARKLICINITNSPLDMYVESDGHVGHGLDGQIEHISWLMWIIIVLCLISSSLPGFLRNVFSFRNENLCILLCSVTCYCV